MRRNVAILGPFLALPWAGLALGQAAPAVPPGSPSAPVASARASAGSPPGVAPAQPAPPAPTPPAPEAPVAPSPEPVPPPAETPPPEPAPAPAETAPEPPTAPAHIAPTRVETSRPEEDRSPRKERDAWREGDGLGIEGTFSVASRIGSFSDGYANEEHFDTALQLGAWLGLSAEWALGLEFEHAGLGRAAATSGRNSVSVEYDVNYVWLGARVFPYRGDSLELFLNLRVGLGWQSFDATGTRELLPTTSAPQAFSCSASDGPGLGLGAGVGAAYRISRTVLVLGRVDGLGRRLSGEVIDGCAAGSGDVTGVNVGAGLMYVFDLGQSASLAARSTTPAHTW